MQRPGGGVAEQDVLDRHALAVADAEEVRRGAVASPQEGAGAVDRAAAGDPDVFRAVDEEQARERHRPAEVAGVGRQRGVTRALDGARVERVVGRVARALEHGAGSHVQRRPARDAERSGPEPPGREHHATAVPCPVEGGLDRCRRAAGAARIGAELAHVDVRAALGGAGLELRWVRKQEQVPVPVDGDHDRHGLGQHEPHRGPGDAGVGEPGGGKRLEGPGSGDRPRSRP